MRRVLAMLMGVSVVLGPLLVSSPTAVSAATSSTPQLTLTPDSGPAGTLVQISGQLTPPQAAEAGEFEHPGYFNLLTEVTGRCPSGSQCAQDPGNLAGCELIVALVAPAVHVDPTTLQISGSFRVGDSGTCFQDRPDALRHPTLPGFYALSIGCHACQVGFFTVTAGAALPNTGSKSAELAVLGVLLLISGTVVTLLSRDRRSLRFRP